jgi:hypothetical protein
MTDALGAIESAITEVTKARAAIKKSRSKQVSAENEIDRIKSLAFAWFETHRPNVATHGSQPDLSNVDLCYRTIMDATGRRTTRASYSSSLLAARRSLLELRSFVATHLHVSPPSTAAPTLDIVPNFAPLAFDPRMQRILQRRWDEVQRCIAVKANLAATVMMGGLLESLLLARINVSPNKAAIFKAKGAPRDKKGKVVPLPEWKLIHMVEVGHELSWMTKSAKDVGNVLRDFRNYIHPHKEHTDGVLIGDEDARMFWEVTKSISRHVLNSVGKAP